MGDPPGTLGAIWQWAGQMLAGAGFADARWEARHLIEAVLDLAPGSCVVMAGRPLSDTERTRLEAAVQQRAAGVPLGRIVGWREFWSLRLGLHADTLEPRPDSETLVRAVLGCATPQHRQGTILDLGCGTGCLGLALISEWPDALLWAVDRAFGAVAMTIENARAHDLAGRVRGLQGNWADALEARFDVIVSNPPYIPRNASLDQNVRDYDPALALYGGLDGLDAYRLLLPRAKELLKTGGICAMEIGAGQADDVARLAQQAGWQQIERHHDIQGHERIVVLQ